MGNSKSTATVKQSLQRFTLTDDSQSIAAEYINKIVQNEVMEVVNRASSTVNLSQTLIFSDIKAAGNIEIKTNQAQVSNIDMTQVSSTSIVSTVSNELLEQMSSNLATSLDADLMAAFDSKVKQTAESGATSLFSKATTESNIDQAVRETSISKTSQSISKLFENVIEKNLTVEAINECINSVSNTQYQLFEDIAAGGNISIDAQQNQSVQTLTECVQQTDIGGGIINDLTTFLTTKNEAGRQYGMEFTAGSKNDQEATVKGIFEELGDMIGNIFGGLLASIPAMLLPIVGPSVAICVLLCICVGCFIMIRAAMDNKSSKAPAIPMGIPLGPGPLPPAYQEGGGCGMFCRKPKLPLATEFRK